MLWPKCHQTGSAKPKSLVPDCWDDSCPKELTRATAGNLFRSNEYLQIPRSHVVWTITEKLSFPFFDKAHNTKFYSSNYSRLQLYIRFVKQPQLSYDNSLDCHVCNSTAKRKEIHINRRVCEVLEKQLVHKHCIYFMSGSWLNIRKWVCV